MKFTITYNDDTTVEGWVGPRAEVEVERKFNIAAGDATHNEHTYFLFWAALHYAGQEKREFDDWLADIKEWNVVDGAAAVNPTRRVRRPAKSSP